MIKITWSPEARLDLERLHGFIAQYSGAAAKNAILTILKEADLIANNPEIGRPWHVDPTYREMIVPFGARAYIIRYRLVSDMAVIFRVWHGFEDRGPIGD